MGGRGANSSKRENGWGNLSNQRLAGIMNKLGITRGEYESNVTTGNRLYMGIIDRLTTGYEKETGKNLTFYGNPDNQKKQQEAFDEFIRKQNIRAIVKNDNSLSEDTKTLKSGRKVQRAVERYDRQIKEAINYNPYARKDELRKIRQSIRNSKILTDKDKRFLINTFYRETFSEYLRDGFNF